MDDAEFWALIDSSREKADGDPEEQFEVLKEMLAARAPSMGARTGRDEDEFPESEAAVPSEPSGTRWSEEDLAARYPQLTSLFDPEGR